jgi:hypothetical protein
MTDARGFGLLIIGGWVLLSVAFLGAWSFLLHCYRLRFPRRTVEGAETPQAGVEPHGSPPAGRLPGLSERGARNQVRGHVDSHRA